MPHRPLRVALLSALTVGCHGAPVPPAQEPGVTWHGDIHPLVAEHCGACHADGGVADRRPFETYEQTQPFAALLALHTAQRTMPPFIADDTDDCAPRFSFRHDTRLTDEEVRLFADWAAAGAPRGEARDAAPLPDPVPFGLEDYDVELVPEHGYAMPKGDGSICWSLDPGVPPGTWLDAVEVVPGDHRITHHVVVQVHDDPSIDAEMGELGYWECTGVPLGGTDLEGWLPGARPARLPDGVGVALNPDSRITLQVHYHNVHDEPIYDLTRLRLRFKPGGPDAYVQPRFTRFGNAKTAAQGLQPGPHDDGDPVFLVPAGASGHTEEMLLDVPGQPGQERYVFMIGNHMHQLGVDMRIWVVHDPATKAPDEPDTECLLATPRYDFGWQTFFHYDANQGRAPVVRPGDRLRLRCTYDNSENNEAWMEALVAEGLPAVPVDVAIGESSLDEMCVSMMGLLDKAEMDALR